MSSPLGPGAQELSEVWSAKCSWLGLGLMEAPAVSGLHKPPLHPYAYLTSALLVAFVSKVGTCPLGAPRYC